ncbi:hypothetical protein [Roseiconus lacunae]|uniref:hypothetical protein n=1 Tax=Roseiconus lacunae TaxID=2605694 RepID=UPI0011F0DB5D|nr:hypothetical protein [Roseiconus lacunae]MCD0460129.1 hypothetical protein [Roseiconus lacunae]WRQ50594.1 hypothetical protein U8335_27055 [Stieleria sp. HD01]
MQAFDLDSHSPQGPSEYPPVDHWSIPVGRLAGVQLYLSYSVFIALAVLAVVIATVQNRQGEADLPVIASAAMAFWVTGWCVQLIVYLMFQNGPATRSDVLTIGLIGVEVGHPLSRPICWTAATNLVVTSIALGGLSMFGVACLVVHLHGQSLPIGSFQSWRQALATPGFGLGSINNVYLSAAWLFWFQAFCQAYPMPRNLGRGALVSAMVLFASEANEAFKLKLVRRVIQLVSIVTVLVALSVLVVETAEGIPRWLVLLALALLLWQSSGRRDLIAWIRSIEIAKLDQSTVPSLALEGADSDSMDSHRSISKLAHTRPRRNQMAGPLWQMIDTVQMHRKRRRAKAVWKRERSEAEDAARLDEILERVNEQGIESLSPDELALLQRVSESLRKNRPAEDSTGG